MEGVVQAQLRHDVRTFEVQLILAVGFHRVALKHACEHSELITRKRAVMHSQERSVETSTDWHVIILTEQVEVEAPTRTGKRMQIHSVRAERIVWHGDQLEWARQKS
eukprot:2378253-Prymnesium_polylepis.2